MPTTQPKQAHTAKNAVSHGSRPAVAAYDPYFPQKTTIQRDGVAATASLIYSPHFPKLAQQAV